ncbi:ComEC/Rec2 family competence protein [Oceanobacillus saliphilus]|uniref:ComEC/Rec2 family competence protein n=1 Tax=Oceanobacillus saliphilus TaxID=2925834 RepID=UPI00201D872C|nr:MBL fold metallo-hydrolase [Oceanobacillus saliphilus]
MKRLIGFIMITNLFIFTYPVQGNNDSLPEMQVHFIDVGQGDSILIQTPQNRSILIDGGPPGAGKKILSYLEDLGIEKLDLLIATHPDIDHIGGLPEVIESIKIERILDTGRLHPTQTFANYINQIRNHNIPVQIAEKNVPIELDAMIDIEVWNAYERYKNNNKSSIVLKLSYGEIDFLFMSDVGKEQEKSFLEEYDVQAEIIKVAHHGSKTSSSLRFLQEVEPEVAILTYSKENDYGHPVEHVIDNLNQVNSMIYSTAAVGNVVINTDGFDYVVIPQKNPIKKLIEAIR